MGSLGTMSSARDTFVCSRGHASTEADYCSECGARIGAQIGAADQPVASPAAAAVSLPIAESCPACGVVREQHDIAFCEICGYNFVTGASGTEPPPAPPPLPLPAAPVPASAARVWQVEVSADPALHEPGSPEPPADLAPVTLTLSQPVSLIGRRSGARAIEPEIDLSHDSAVSHRHALLMLDGAGGLLLRDIGAANGTRLNGTPVEPLRDHPLADGDEITLGHWTRLHLKAVD